MLPGKELLHIHTVSISEVLSASFGHNTGDRAGFDLLTGKKHGHCSKLRTVRGPTPDGLLLLELTSPSSIRAQVELQMNPISSKHFSVLMYNIEPEKIVHIPSLRQPLKLTGPAVVLIGQDIFVYDSKEVSVHRGFIKPDQPIFVFVVGRSVTIQNRMSRTCIKMPETVQAETVTLVACFNLPLPGAANPNHTPVPNQTSAMSVVPAKL